MIVTVASKKDFNFVAKLEQELFGAEAYGLESLQQEFSNPRRLILVAQQEDDVLGYIILNLLPDQTAEIMKIGVGKMSQRQGVGHALLHCAKQMLHELGMTQLWLEVHQQNTAAIAFYQKSGFQYLGVKKHYYLNGDDAQIYQLSL